MSLDDQFNSDDGSTIDRLDTSLFTFNKRIATTWQNRTYRSKADLESVLYFGSAVGLGGCAISTGNFFMIMPALFSALKCSFKTLRPTSAKEEEMQLEVVGLPNKSIKYLNVFIYGGGILATGAGIGQVIAGAISGNDEFYRDSIKHFSLALGTIGWISADYMAKSDLGPPPKKPRKKPFLERMKQGIEALLPPPAPSPAYMDSK